MSVKYDPLLGKLVMLYENAPVRIIACAVLPESGENGAIYRVPSTEPDSGNRYTEYYWTGGEWEKMGEPGSTTSLEWDQA